MHHKARAFAIQAHGSQQYGHHPYVYHLDQVAHYAKDYGDAAQTVAYLHDILEDTAVKEQEIRQLFGEQILKHVELLTDPQGESRRVRKFALNIKLTQADTSLHLALIVKVADRVANVKESLATGHHKMWKKYHTEYAEFRKAAYRSELCERLWKILDVLMEDDAFEHFKHEV